MENKEMIPYPYNCLKLTSETDRHWNFLCPFHKETNGSFVVNKNEPYKLFYKCFGCGAYGSARDFAKKFNMSTAKIPPITDAITIMKEACKINWETKRGCPLKHIPAEEQRLAELVGVSVETIRKFGIGWKDYRFLIPMYDEQGICGISVRYYQPFNEFIGGKDIVVNKCFKRCIKGSKHGQFLPLPEYFDNPKQIFICEGWSDTVVLVELGYYAVGRFNALDTSKTLGHFNKPTYIISDADECGINGSQKLQKLIGGAKVKIIYPPLTDDLEFDRPQCFKDIRDFYLTVGKEQTKQWLEEQL